MTEPGQAGTDGQRLRLVPASAVVMRRVKWLWHNRIPIGEITLIAGREGVGKSTYLADLAAKVTLGTTQGEFLGAPKAVIYLATEDSWRYTIAPRMSAAGTDMSQVYYVESIENDDGLLLPRDCRELASMALDVGAGAIMCDPIISLIDDRLSTDRSRELRHALEPLRRAAERAMCAVPALVHFNKREGDILTRISGSRGWTEVARAAIGVVKDKENGHYVFSQIKNNLGPLDLSHHSYEITVVQVMTVDGPSDVGKIKWLGKVDEGVEEIIENDRKDNGKGKGRPRKAESLGVVEFVINNGQVSVTEVLQAFSDIDERVIRNALAAAVESKLLRRVQGAGAGVYGAPEEPK